MLQHGLIWRFLTAVLVIGFGVSFVEGQGESIAGADVNTVFTDDFDADTKLWTYAGNPAVSMEWDAVEGSPKPGSMKLSISQPPPTTDGFIASSKCMESNPDELWGIQADVKKADSFYGNCLAFIQFFETADCTGEGSIIGNFPGLDQDEWRQLNWAFRSPPARPSVRAVLLLHATILSGPMSCNFDSVTVYNDRAPSVTIPTLSVAGYLTIAALLALIGCVLLARRRPAP